MAGNADTNPYTPPLAAVADAAEAGEDSTFQLNLFSPAGRIGRLRYLTYSFGLSLLLMVAGSVLAAVLGVWFIVLMYAAIGYVHVMLAIKRSHDFDTTGWLSLLVFVPVANLAFLFIPGTDGPNRFGNKTAPNGNSIVIAVLVGIMLIGILAAIAIPAYSSFANRARAAQAQR